MGGEPWKVMMIERAGMTRIVPMVLRRIAMREMARTVSKRRTLRRISGVDARTSRSGSGVVGSTSRSSLTRPSGTARYQGVKQVNRANVAGRKLNHSSRSASATASVITYARMRPGRLVPAGILSLT